MALDTGGRQPTLIQFHCFFIWCLPITMDMGVIMRMKMIQRRSIHGGWKGPSGHQGSITNNTIINGCNVFTRSKPMMVIRWWCASRHGQFGNQIQPIGQSMGFVVIPNLGFQAYAQVLLLLFLIFGPNGSFWMGIFHSFSSSTTTISCSSIWPRSLPVAIFHLFIWVPFAITAISEGPQCHPRMATQKQKEREIRRLIRETFLLIQ